MGQTKGMPEDDVRVVNGAVGPGGFDPGWEALRWFTRGLGNMAAGRVDLVVGVCSGISEGSFTVRQQEGLTFSDMHSMTGKTGSFPDQAVFLGKQRRYLTADQLVTDRLLAVGVQFAGIGHLPSPAGVAVIVGHGFQGRVVLGLLGVEGIAVLVFGAANFRRAAGSVDLEDGIVGPIDVRVDSQTEQMLVVVGVDAGVDLGAPAVGVLAGVHGIGVEDTSQLDVQLDCSVLVENPVHAVFVISGSEDLRDDQFPGTGDDHGFVAEVSVLVQDSVVLFVNADGVLHDCAGACSVHEDCIHVVNGALAITTQRQTVGHVSTAILAQIKSMLSLVRVVRVSIWNHHLSHGQTIKDRSDISLVIKSNVVEHDTFTVVEAHMNVPVLPLDLAPLDREGNALWLRDVNGLQVCPETAFSLDGSRVVVVGGSLAKRSAHRRHINVDDLLRFRIEDGTKVQGIGVLGVVDMRTVVHKRLLQSNIRTETLIVSDRPG